ALDHPRDLLSVLAGHLEVEPRMRVHPLDLRDLPLELDRPVDRELRRERMMRGGRSAHEGDAGRRRGEEGSNESTMHRNPSSISDTPRRCYDARRAHRALLARGRRLALTPFLGPS